MSGPKSPFADSFTVAYKKRFAEAVALRSPSTLWDDPTPDPFEQLAAELRSLSETVSQAIEECLPLRRQRTPDLTGLTVVVAQDPQTHHDEFKKSYPYLGVERASMRDFLSKQPPQRTTRLSANQSREPLTQQVAAALDKLAARR